MQALRGENPVFKRLTRRSKGPSTRVVLWLAFGSGVALLVLSAWALLDVVTHAEWRQLYAGGNWVRWQIKLRNGPLTYARNFALFVTFSSPLITAIAAAQLAARDASHNHYDLVRSSAIPAARMLWGYVLAALHRVRVLLGLLAAVLPLIAIGTLYRALQTKVFFTLLNGLTVWRRDVFAPTLLAVALTVGLWGINLLAAAWGVGVGLRSRNPVSSALIAGLAMLAVLLVLQGVVLGRPLIHVALPEWLRLDTPLRIATAGGMVAAPYAMGLALVRLLRRWV